jgi:hypothetical protein
VQSPLEVTVAGQVMLLLSRHGLRDARCLAIYRRAVLDAVRHCAGEEGADSLMTCSTVVRDQIDLLERAIQRRLGHEIELYVQPRAGAAVPGVGESAAQAPAQATTAEDGAQAGATLTDQASGPGSDPEPGLELAQAPGHRMDAEIEPTRPERHARQASGYVPVAKSMEEKLHDEREPIQKLLVEDCVSAGLIDLPAARQMVAGMAGKTSRDAEREIVERLRQVLQDQARYFIRKAKGGPWANPRTQEDLRQDIHAASSVRSVLLLHRQIVKEYHAWQKEHGRIGILGLFAARRRIVK